MEQSAISIQQIKESIPESLRPFIRISQSSLSPACLPVICALSEASKIIENIMFTPKCVDLIFGSTNFTVNMATSGKFIYTISGDVINAYFKDMIFIDCDKMLKYPPQIQIVCILEEFVHAFLNVANENLAIGIVALLYDKVKIENGQYFVK